jgi:hypothetical protein
LSNLFRNIIFQNFRRHAILWRFSVKRAALAEGELRMAQELAPPARRRRLNGHGMMVRRKRIFAGLRDGLRYDEIAAQEGVTTERIRQIVAEVLKNRAVDSSADHAKLQLDRLIPALQIAAEAVASGDVRAIPSYLKVLDRLDRYQATAATHEVSDDEARKKLLDKINRLAENLGINKDFEAAVQAHLKKTGQIPADAPGEANGLDVLNASLAEGPKEEHTEATNWMSV